MRLRTSIPQHRKTLWRSIVAPSVLVSCLLSRLCVPLAATPWFSESGNFPEPQPKALQFEAASIRKHKENDHGDSGPPIVISGSSVSTSTTLLDIFLFAWDIKHFQLSPEGMGN